MSLFNQNISKGRLAVIAAFAAAVCLVFILCPAAGPVQAAAGRTLAVEADSVNGHENLPPGVPETEAEPEAVADPGDDVTDEPTAHLPAVIFIIAAAVTGAAFLFFIRKFISRRP